MKHRSTFGIAASLALALSCVFAAGDGWAAAPTCAREVTANIVAIDQPVMFNRLGASNVNAMVFARARDVVITNVPGIGAPIELLRPDKRPRPLILRVRVGDCLTIKLRNGLRAANPFNNVSPANPLNIPPLFTTAIDGQVADRRVSLHVSGMQWANGPLDDGSFVGNNSDSTVARGAPVKTYKLYAEKEGAFPAAGMVSVVGSDGNQGDQSNLLFGEVIVEPKDAAIYRGQVAEEEMRLSADANGNGSLDPNEKTAQGHPIINYDKVYPNVDPWISEGKAGLPILNMICNAAAAATGKCAQNEIVHSEINAFVGYGPNGTLAAAPDGPYAGKLGHFPKSTYPLENVGLRNPTVPNRLEPFRDFASIFHDEPATKQAFPAFYEPSIQGGSDVFNYVLAGVKDGFMINYGSGGIGSEIIANRLGVGPMHDCLTCAYEEFFLTSFTTSDPATLVDIPANVGLETLQPGVAPPAGSTGPKATKALYTEDPANIHHSYTGDFAKIRNVHVGKEQHVFHLHNHQWLYNPNDDNSNYLDAQGIGPGVGYTYEINFGGSGNRNKTSGDAIFHCHFYPHFAQGMWYHWRNHDVFEAGTVLQTTLDGGGWHVPFTTDGLGLGDGTPAPGARALPDGEIVAGVPIPAVVPLPGKPMAPMPGPATVKPNPLTTTASVFSPITPGGVVPVGSLASVTRPLTTNPGYPFWVAGIEDIVGQRPPTPPLDMLTPAQATALKSSGNSLWSAIDPAQADGWNGGLPRAALQGYAAGGHSVAVTTKLDFSKVVEEAQAVFYPEEGTDLEQLAMAYHAIRNHPTYLSDGVGTTAASFVLNGSPPVVGAPFHEPCIDDQGNRMTTASGGIYNFFSATGMTTHGSSVFNASTPRIYKGANIQYDAVFNKAGYHYPQQRIIALWQDAVPVITKQQAGQPLVMRLNTFDCALYHHTNLVPEAYELDDYQVRTPTDIIGQHIHLPKWDLTTADGAANGWNYEDGTLSPGAVQERIHALNTFKNAPGSPGHLLGTGSLVGVVPTGDLAPAAHPYFSTVAPPALANSWMGARTTMQRWFADPVVNTETVDRGLGIVFTHDHYGPSTHQQIGLYATVLAEPAGSRWAHNETGAQLGDRAVYRDGGRMDGGPTAWQAAILPPASAPNGTNVGANTLEPFREFYFEYSDFQHAYEAGVYVGAGHLGQPLGEPTPGVETPVFTMNAGNPDFNGNPADAFRFAINPPARAQIAPVFPDLVLEVAQGGLEIPGCPTRPCPQAIDVQDPGMFVVNYRNEPLGLRIYDPNKLGPDGKPGMQADGPAGDLAFALSSNLGTDSAGNPILRKIPQLNTQPAPGSNVHGTVFPPSTNAAGVGPGDPFTPMIRTFAGDVIRVKMQAGAHEEEHNATIHGVKWLQAGSGHGKAGNSGWRNAQAGGISEQFTLAMPVVPVQGQGSSTDYAYIMDASDDGWWSGMWGVIRSYNNNQNDLFKLPTTIAPTNIANANVFNGICPKFVLDESGNVVDPPGKDKNIPVPVRAYDITAVLANDVLPVNGDVTIADLNPAGHAGNHPLNPAGGTLVYNPRIGPLGMGPIHDPTAILYVRTADIDPATGKLFANVKVEPLVLRAAAGECIEVTLRNALPPQVNVQATDAAGNPLTTTVTNPDGTTTIVPVTVPQSVTPDLASYTTLQGTVKRDRGIVSGVVTNPAGATTFQPNLARSSGHVGLHPQLVMYDVTRSNGMHVGGNGTGQGRSGIVPSGGSARLQWYAGDINPKRVGNGNNTKFQLTATPVEFGGSNLQPADPIKQGAKSLVGQLVIEPQGATWNEDADDAAGRQTATVNMTDGTSFRDFSTVFTKALTHYYANSSPVEHINGEGLGIPEDSGEANGMAINYGIEPIWFRLGIPPNAPFGNAASPPGTTFGGEQQFDVFSNSKVGGDPATPVFTVAKDQPFRMRVTNAYGTARGTTFQLHGHVWQRDPYVCPGSKDGIAGRCATNVVGSQMIGDNKQAFYQGGQESLTPAAHFDIVPTRTGLPGDYLFRDSAAFGDASGLWGIVRVLP